MIMDSSAPAKVNDGSQIQESTLSEAPATIDLHVFR